MDTGCAGDRCTVPDPADSPELWSLIDMFKADEENQKRCEHSRAMAAREAMADKWEDELDERECMLRLREERLQDMEMAAKEMAVRQATMRAALPRRAWVR